MANPVRGNTPGPWQTSSRATSPLLRSLLTTPQYASQRQNQHAAAVFVHGTLMIVMFIGTETLQQL